jgi:hypothetical protein
VLSVARNENPDCWNFADFEVANSHYHPRMASPDSDIAALRALIEANRQLLERLRKNVDDLEKSKLQMELPLDQTTKWRIAPPVENPAAPQPNQSE